MSRILDFSRASVVCESPDALAEVIRKIKELKDSGVIIPIRIKNRVKHATEAGYRDIMMNIRIPQRTFEMNETVEAKPPGALEYRKARIAQINDRHSGYQVATNPSESLSGGVEVGP